MIIPPVFMPNPKTRIDTIRFLRRVRYAARGQPSFAGINTAGAEIARVLSDIPNPNLRLQAESILAAALRSAEQAFKEDPTSFHGAFERGMSALIDYLDTNAQWTADS